MRLLDAIHLPFTADVILKFRDKRQDTHHQLARARGGIDCRIVNNLERNALVGKLDGFKPFLKGFTAAHCRANIIVPKGESDAIYYLSSDYPYLLADESLTSVLDMIERTKASFGGEEWRRGLEIMETVRQRSSPEQIGSEIEALIGGLG
jgi:hypothetical protein